MRDYNFDPEYIDGAHDHFVAACALTDMAQVDGLVFVGTFHGTVINGKVTYFDDDVDLRQAV